MPRSAAIRHDVESAFMVAVRRSVERIFRTGVQGLLCAVTIAHGAPASNEGRWVSPDGQKIVFLKRNAEAMDTGIHAPPGGRPEIDLWISEADGSNAHVLMAGVGSSRPENNLTDIDVAAFSPDGDTLYFETSAWLTSRAIHAVDIHSGKQHLVTDGWLNHVVRAGPYKGDIVVMQHRHFVGSGTYNWYWLLSPDGKEIGPIGPVEADTSGVRNLKDFEEDNEH